MSYRGYFIITKITISLDISFGCRKTVQPKMKNPNVKGTDLALGLWIFKLFN